MKEERLLPHDITAERAVLGGILIDPPAIYDVAHLRPEHFFKGQHGRIFTLMREMSEAGTAIDFITMQNRLTNEQAAYLAGLMNEVPTATMTRHYGDIVWQTAKRRELIRAAGEVATTAWDEEQGIDAVFSKAQTAILDAVDGGGRGDATSAKDGLKSLFDETARRYAKGGEDTGLATGFMDLDRLLDGLEGGNLYILAARPGMGKSALEGCIRLNASREGSHVLSFNLEMPELQSWQRLVAIDTGIDFTRIRRGNMTPEEWVLFGESIGRMTDLPMWINDTPGMTPDRMHSEARRHQAVYGLDLITIDYLQLMASNNRYGNRVSEVGDISRGLKQLALSLDVPVIALSQLSRACEQRADKRPILSDLRDSGDIEQDADVVMFIYRDDYYYKDESQRPNVAEVHIAKHRNGPTGQADLFFDKAKIRFRSLQRESIRF